MTEKEKLILAQMQIGNLTELLKDNKYREMIYGHLISIDVELGRQLSVLTNTNNSIKIEE